ncbi:MULTISPECIES: phosphoribosyltransferase [unclassified Nostoc]|uniref:phosphoribosyltransferase n=1 Tax=unclassified Nostoc TaxID=2593658 RepID=UPI002AD5ACFD|nr:MULTISPECIES: phosphoribosyltransferase family protein [unclassified Nostoc]MDZ8121556.1 phosphoribosyltransferase family protein [Nostoc sp. CmiVER01]MDZ8222561.1 phosphoribosyltransferase family protein [Nostoc sp. ChiVER01]
MLHTPLFADRTHAGEELARVIHDVLTQQTIDSGVKPIPIVYALPRGGIPVAAPIARLLDCPLTIVVAKKISHPENPELAIGAVTTFGNVLWADQKLSRFKNDARWREVALNKAINLAKSLEALLIPACPQVNVENATLILVDDGIATGMTIAVAATALKTLSPAAVWLCTPVAPQTLLPWLEQWGDRTIVLQTPEPFWSVSNFYTEFPQVDTLEALAYLQQQKTMEEIDLCE